MEANAMARQEDLDLLKQGVDAWNAWKKLNPYSHSNLEGADLRGMNLSKVNSSEAVINVVDLYRTNIGIDFSGAYL
jgi:uncharacterized protein YjbI with pentapeptide repeats